MKLIIIYKETIQKSWRYVNCKSRFELKPFRYIMDISTGYPSGQTFNAVSLKRPLSSYYFRIYIWHGTVNRLIPVSGPVRASHHMNNKFIIKGVGLRLSRNFLIGNYDYLITGGT